MRKILSLLLLVITLPILGQRTNINRDWRFFRGTPESQPIQKDYDDSHWEQIGIPHSFSIPYWLADRFYTGDGWYRKTIQLKKSQGKQVYLDFEGVFQFTEIYINGQKAGTHNSGYVGFTIDITPFVRPGINQVAIRVNNEWNAQTAPRAGEHVFSGGIYRDVFLRVEEPVHIAWYGTYVTTPTVNEKNGRVKIATEIENHATKEQEITVEQIIRNPQGKVIDRFSNRKMVSPGQKLTLEQVSSLIAKPELWSPEKPALYKIETILRKGGRAYDKETTTFGFRWFTWSAKEGFSLNGKHYYLKGANVHQDHAGWGDAVTQSGIYRDLKLMKDAGFNFVRGSHYPHHPYFSQVCDEMGLLFLSENNFWGIGGFKKEGFWDACIYPTNSEDEKPFEASAFYSLEQMIRIHRNHASILAWSMCNEPFFAYKEVLPKIKNFLERLVEKTHKLDPTRKTVIGGAQREGMDQLGDIAGYNGDGATIFRTPTLPSMVSEYGSCISDRPGEYDACWGHVTGGEQPAWRAGHAIWCGFDHGSIAGDMGKMGIVDYHRLPKRSWYWYRNYHLGIAPPAWPQQGTPEALKLSTDKAVLHSTNGTEDAHIIIKITDKNGNQLSNTQDVTLRIVSGPGEFPTGRSITFRADEKAEIRIIEGMAAIEFRSYEGGTTCIKATSEGMKADSIFIKTLGQPQYKEGVTPTAISRESWKKDQTTTSSALINVSQSRPIQVSSFQTDAKGGYMTDENENTCWNPLDNDNTPWLNLDMENFYQVQLIGLLGTVKASQIQEISTSGNGRTWQTLPWKATQSSDKQLVLSCQPTVKGRFLRIKFKEKIEAIYELSVLSKH